MDIIDKHEGDKKGFTQLSKTSYGETILNKEKNVKDIVTIGFYAEEGGTSGEFEIRWEVFKEGYKEIICVPKLEIFNDAWSSLSNMPELIKFLGRNDNKNITADELCSFLEYSGYENRV